MINVVVCDDHGIIRSGIRRILETTPDLQLVAAAPTGTLLMSAIEEFKPPLAVVDIRLSDCSGLDLLKRIATISPRTRVVMLSMYKARGYIDKAKTLGARGYIAKECLDEELIAVLRSVISDDNGDFVTFVPQSAELRCGHPDPVRNVGTLLSSRELEVLKLIVSGLTSAEAADVLRVSARTVESHRASVQRKLSVRSRAELARVARAAGLMDCE
jgi:DNA-binding NarL/FixJ family response regulator